MIYPNPASELVQIQLKEQVDKIIISDLNGKVLITLEDIDHSLIQLDIIDWKRGLYFIQSINEFGESHVEHLIVQ